MKFLAIFLAVVSVIGIASATICAIDFRSGGPQNFDSREAMEAENDRGGCKYFKNKCKKIFFGISI